MNLDELLFVENLEENEQEDFQTMFEQEKEKVQKILQSLDSERLKDN